MMIRQKNTKETASDRGAYHGIIVDASLVDISLLDSLLLLGTKKAGDWRLFKVAVPARDISMLTRKVQKSLREGCYAHFYRDQELIIVFPQNIIRTATRQNAWQPAIEYGTSLGIPLEQLTFSPCRFEDETY